MTVFFGSSKQIDNILKKFNRQDILALETVPRKVSRRIYDSPIIEMINVPPYIKAANSKLQQEELIFTLGYFTSLATIDINMLPEFINNKVLISNEDNNIYGPRTILAAFLTKLGYEVYYFENNDIHNKPLNNIELRYINNENDINKDLIKNLKKQKAYKLFNITNWGQECLINTFSRIQQLFPYFSFNDSLNTILDRTSLKTFINSNKQYIDLVNQGHYLPSLFNETKEDQTLSSAELLARIMISRQAITSKFVQTVISISADIIRDAYQS